MSSYAYVFSDLRIPHIFQSSNERRVSYAFKIQHLNILYNQCYFTFPFSCVVNLLMAASCSVEFTGIPFFQLTGSRQTNSFNSQSRFSLKLCSLLLSAHYIRRFLILAGKISYLFYDFMFFYYLLNLFYLVE